jgi:putative DNA primase/helicase
VHSRTLPGILRWAVQGAVDWQAGGLRPPKAAIDATDRYRVDSDLIAQFLEDNCVTGPEFQVRSTDLYNDYKLWCFTNGLDHPSSQKALAKRLDEAGFDRTENAAGQSVWIGLDVVQVVPSLNDLLNDKRGVTL